MVPTQGHIVPLVKVRIYTPRNHGEPGGNPDGTLHRSVGENHPAVKEKIPTYQIARMSGKTKEEQIRHLDR